MKANLLIALSDRRTQETLADLIDREKGAEVTVHTLRDPFTLLQTVKSLRPDIVIVSCNVCSPPMIETVRTIADLPKARDEGEDVVVLAQEVCHPGVCRVVYAVDHESYLESVSDVPSQTA